MVRILPTSIGLSLLLIGTMVATACQQPANPRVASTGLALALELRVDNESIAEHFVELREQISLEKGKLKFKELSGDELDTKTWCFMKYAIGDTDWGIVPGTDRDCTDDDDDDAKKRAKRRAKRWLAKQTQADEVRAEIDYLVTDGWYERALKAVSQSAVSGFDFGACVEDAIGVSADLARRQAEARCAALMDNEELAVVELLGERGLKRLGVDLEGVDDEDQEKAMKKYLAKLGELTGADGAAFLMLVNDGWGTACFNRKDLDHDESARAQMLRVAVELCGGVSEKVAQGR
jgi:hypothetical protein